MRSLIKSDRPVKNIVILISGRGSNMQAIVNACQQEGWPARIAAVISNTAEAYGIAWAQERGLTTEVLSHRDFKDRQEFDLGLARLIDSYHPDLVVLAGFMRILGADFVCHYERRLMNIHPSLLPAFTGLETHQRALSSGVLVHGCTVHFVTPILDQGPIVAQAVVPVLNDDSPETLSQRVLCAEHKIYPLAVKWFVQEQLSWHQDRVVIMNNQQRCFWMDHVT